MNTKVITLSFSFSFILTLILLPNQSPWAMGPDDHITPSMLGATTLKIGTNEYRIGEFLGKGKNGVVYKLEKGDQGPDYVIKIMNLPVKIVDEQDGTVNDIYKKITEEEEYREDMSSYFFESEFEFEKYLFQNLGQKNLSDIDVQKITSDHQILPKIAYVKSYVPGATLFAHAQAGNFSTTMAERLIDLINDLVKSKLNVRDLNIHNLIYNPYFVSNNGTMGKWVIVDGFVEKGNEMILDTCSSLQHYYGEIYKRYHLAYELAQREPDPQIVVYMLRWFIEASNENQCQKLTNEIERQLAGQTSQVLGQISDLQSHRDFSQKCGAFQGQQEYQEQQGH